MKEDTSLHSLEILKIKRDYYKQLYNNKLKILDEMDKFLETKSTKSDTREKRDNMSSPIFQCPIASQPVPKLSNLK